MTSPSERMECLSLDDKPYTLCPILSQLINESNNHETEDDYENEEDSWNSGVQAWSDKEVEYRIEWHNKEVKHLLECKDKGCQEYVRTIKAFPSKIQFKIISKREDFLQ